MAIGHAVLNYARAVHAFFAGIKCPHCTIAIEYRIGNLCQIFLAQFSSIHLLQKPPISFVPLSTWPDGQVNSFSGFSGFLSNVILLQLLSLGEMIVDFGARLVTFDMTCAPHHPAKPGAIPVVFLTITVISVSMKI